jgi:hypothetical protein
MSLLRALVEFGAPAFVGAFIVLGYDMFFLRREPRQPKEDISLAFLGGAAGLILAVAAWDALRKYRSEALRITAQ